MKRTLVIIDMQCGFGNANALITINAVIKQIKRAKKFGDVIFVVEYLPHSQYKTTRTEIMEAIGSYAHIKVYKYDDDGSQEILAACDSPNTIPDVFRLCGVNTNACVQATLRGLHRKKKYNSSYKLEIVPEACNGFWGKSSQIFEKFSDELDAKSIGRVPIKRPVRYI